MDTDLLLSHEQFDSCYVTKLAEAISGSGIWTQPIIVEDDRYIVLDGHHRLESARRLSLSKVPCACVHYNSDIIEVLAWRCGEVIDRDAVRVAAISGDLLPVKTSRHVFSKAVAPERIPLARLKQRRACHE
jgi:hypothetical protein